MKSVFEFVDYKAYLRLAEQLSKLQVRGFRSKLAKHLACNNSFVSQVMNKSANFSPEQAILVTEFLDLKEEEIKYFLLLVDFARAGNRPLKLHLRSEIDEIQKRRVEIKMRSEKSITPSEEVVSLYYSHWLYSALHMLVTMPKYRTAKAITELTGLSNETINETLLFLARSNLIAEKDGEWVPSETLIYLPKNSKFISTHHRNWRIVSAHQMNPQKRESLHYSAISTLSQRDIEILRGKIFELIECFVSTVRNSQPEALYNFNIDFYSIFEDMSG
jgi:uncharacterized protein (TIGR02147 family)